MNDFIETEPELVYDFDQKEWVLNEAFIIKDDDIILLIPAGFTFDLASIPRIFWSIIGPMDLSIEAPLAHDYLYETRCLSRAKADYLFRELMIKEGVRKSRAWIAWAAVRLFGRFAWNKNRPDEGNGLLA